MSVALAVGLLPDSGRMGEEEGVGVGLLWNPSQLCLCWRPPAVAASSKAWVARKGEKAQSHLIWIY